MNLWIVSLFDPTPLDEPIYPRFIEIAKAANRKGHDVTHFTSTFRHTKKAHRFSKSEIHTENDKYHVVFTRSMGYKRNMMPGRFIAHWDYARKLVNVMDGLERPDVIFISTPPLSTIDEVTNWAVDKAIPVIIDIIDPWPDSFIKNVPDSLKPMARIGLTPFYAKLRRAFARSAAITAISNGYLDWASSYLTDSKLTAPFYLAIDIEGIRKTMQAFEDKGVRKEHSELRMIYAGSLASSYDIPTILEAAKIMNEDCPGKTKFIITGTGPQKNIVEQVQTQVSNLQYLGWVSKEELLKQYYLADLGLIQHKNSLTQTITYKFFNYMSAGLPLLNSLQSEMAQLIDQENLGLNNKEGDVDGLVKNIKTYLNNKALLRKHRTNAISFSLDYGDTKVVYDRLVTFLERVAKIE